MVISSGVIPKFHCVARVGSAEGALVGAVEGGGEGGDVQGGTLVERLGEVGGLFRETRRAEREFLAQVEGRPVSM